MLPTLYNDAYNWYWFGALVLTVITSGVSVMFSHAQQYRQHASSRLIGDLLIREQLGFLSFCVALFISAYVQAEQKVMGPFIGALGFLGLLFYSFGFWLSGPSHLSEAFLRDKHQCPQDAATPCTTRPGRHVLFRLVGLPFLLFLITVSYAIVLVFAVRPPGLSAASRQESKLVPAELGIAAITVGDEAYRGTPIFIQDNLDKLDQERRTAKSRDYVVAVLESERLSSYGRFCWAVSLRPDFQNDFALSARGAYLRHATPQVSFTDLSFRGIGAPFKTLVSEVPGSKDDDRIVLVVTLYARSPKPILRDLSVMLETRVDCL